MIIIIIIIIIVLSSCAGLQEADGSGEEVVSETVGDVSCQPAGEGRPQRSFISYMFTVSY